MTEVLRHDSKNKDWKTQKEVVDKIEHSRRCGDTDEDVLKILGKEWVKYGTPDASKDRFSFQDDFGKTKRIADIERAWCEQMNAIKAENVTQKSPARLRGREMVWAFPGSSGQNRVGW